MNNNDMMQYPYVSDTIMSVLIGVLLGLVIYRFYLCPPIVRGPNSRDIVDKVFKINGKFYEFEPIICGCLNPKKTI